MCCKDSVPNVSRKAAKVGKDTARSGNTGGNRRRKPRFPPHLPSRDLSLQARGRRFEPGWLHFAKIL